MARGQPRRRVDPFARAARYRRDARLWAWLFLGGLWLVVPAFIVFSSWREGAPLEDALFSVAGFLAVSAALFVWSRRRTESAWTALVEDKRLTERCERDGTRRVGYRVIARTSTGRRLRVEVTPAAFELLQVGDMLVKQAGFEFPDKVRGSADRERICMACGSVYPVADEACPGCGLENI
jgi:hypothetical protein